MDKHQLCESLIKWLQTFDIDAPCDTLNDISDGVAMAQVLTQIAPEWFTDTWLSKIKTDVGNNWRLKVSNLKKILEGIVDYYQDHLNRQLLDFHKPDVIKIGEKCDASEVSSLLQLLLGCAINCNYKEDYIKKIMAMEESVQQVIMQAIQELEQNCQMSIVGPCGSINTPEYERLAMELDQMTQRCHELDIQVNILQEEKTVILSEMQLLQTKIQELEMGPRSFVDDKRNEVIKLREELLKIETSRDDYRLKVEQQEKEYEELQTKVEDLQKMADEARHLKDEVDILRETADKVLEYEATLSSYKKKLEDYSDLKRRVKVLEDKNCNYVQQVLELEEELKKCGSFKFQLEVYKKQNVELHQRISEETKQVDRLKFDNKKLQENLNALSVERERLRDHLNKLKEINEELTAMRPNSSANLPAERNPLEDETLSVNIISPEIMESFREKLKQLEEDKRMLQQKIHKPEEDKYNFIQALLDDANQQLKHLEQENRTANQRIIELESKLEEMHDTTAPDLRPRILELQEQLRATQAERDEKMSQIDERDALILEYKQKLATHKEILKRKESEINVLEDRYKMSVEKAKQILKSMDTKTSSVAETLKDELNKKHKIIEDLEEEKEQSKSCREMEEKLMTSAFYKLGLMKLRESVDQRLSSLSLSQGHSFLGRQRQSSSRRSVHNFESR